PRARPAPDALPPSQPTFGTDLAGHARHLRGERAELVDHRVDRVFQLEDLAADVDGDLLRQVSLGDRGGDRGDVAHLTRQVARHRVDAVGEVLPRASDTLDDCLAAKLPFRADLARDTGYFGREGT